MILKFFKYILFYIFSITPFFTYKIFKRYYKKSCIFRGLLFSYKNYLQKKQKFNKIIIIIKPDAIGDYILFRNFIKDIKKSKLYNNYKIILFGNIVWKNLSISYDKRFINDFLFFSRNLIRNKLDYNNYIYFKSILSILGAEYIIYPVFSREAFFDEFIFDLYSKYKISFYGNDVNHNKDLKFKYDKYYTTLINTNSMFEFYKYQDFFYYFLQSSNISKSTSIIKNLRKKEYIVISIGANSIKRTWNFSNFDKVIQFLLQHKFQIILLGSNNDLNLFSNYNSEIFNNKNLINLIGKTTLKEFVDIISQAKLLISNESSPVHVAVAVNTSFICISNANHYLRFCPYPSELCNFGRYLFPKNFNNTLSRHELYRKFEYGSELDINSINSDDVIEEIIKILD